MCVLFVIHTMNLYTSVYLFQWNPLGNHHLFLYTILVRKFWITYKVTNSFPHPEHTLSLYACNLYTQINYVKEKHIPALLVINVPRGGDSKICSGQFVRWTLSRFHCHLQTTRKETFVEYGSLMLVQCRYSMLTLYLYLHSYSYTKHQIFIDYSKQWSQRQH